jgi:hypothetical protein
MRGVILAAAIVGCHLAVLWAKSMSELAETLWAWWVEGRGKEE